MASPQRYAVRPEKIEAYSQDPTGLTDEDLASEAGSVLYDVPLSDSDLVAEAERLVPSHIEQLQVSIGPGADVRPVEGLLETTASTATRYLGGTFADTPEGRAKVMDFLAGSIVPGTRVFMDPTTNQPVLQLRDGSYRPLEIPGFRHGAAEMAGDTAELFGSGAPAEAGAATGSLLARATLGPGAGIVGVVGGAITFEGVRQALQAITGIEQQSLDEMISIVGSEGLGQMLPILVPRVARQVFGLGGGKLSDDAKAALAAEERLRKGGFEYGLTPGELTTGAFGRLARQVNILSSRAQAYFGNRSVRLTAMLRDLPDQQARGRLREFVARDFSNELALEQRAILDAARVNVLHPEAYDAIRKTWQDMMINHRRGTQAAVSAAYRDADDLMASAGLRENYFFQGSRGDEIFDEIATIRASRRPPRTGPLADVIADMTKEVRRGEAQGVRGMAETMRRAQNPLTGEVMEGPYTVRAKLQDFAEELYDVSANESLPGLERSQARSLRRRVLAALEEPMLEPIPGQPGNVMLAQEAIAQHETARRMARERFNSLEQLDGLGITATNPRPIGMLEGVVKAEKPDEVLALARVHGGIELARDVFFSELIRKPEQMGRQILDTRPEILLTILGGDRAAFSRVRSAASEIESLTASGAWDALRKHSRDVGLARSMLFQESSAARDAVLHQVQRSGGLDSPLGRATEAGVVAELMHRSLDDAKAGVDLKPEVFHRHLRELEREGVLDFVRPQVRETLRSASTLATFVNLARPDSGSSLEAASTVARLRTGRFLDALGELGLAEGLALVLSNPKATAIFAAVDRAGDPGVVFDLLAGMAGALAARATRDSEGSGPEPAGVE